jgi:hypothetical protein
VPDEIILYGTPLYREHDLSVETEPLSLALKFYYASLKFGSGLQLAMTGIDNFEPLVKDAVEALSSR